MDLNCTRWADDKAARPVCVAATLSLLCCPHAGLIPLPLAPHPPPPGMWTVRYFKSKQYNWSGISMQPSLLAKAKRGLMQVAGY